MGVATVWWGFEKTRKLFRFESTPVALWHWLARIPISASGRNVTVEIQGVAISTSSLRAHARVGTTDTSVEARLAVLEQNFAQMEARVVADIDDLGKRVATLSQAHARATQEQGVRVTNVEQQLLAAQTGGLDLSLGGLVWLTVGVIAASVPGEVARLFGLL